MGVVVKMARDGADYSSRQGARALGDMILAYWRRRGFMGIAVTLEKGEWQIDGTNVGGFYNVRTNIGPKGFPPKV